MSAKIRSIGIIRLQPPAPHSAAAPCDDSTLDLFLAGLASCRVLAAAPIPRRQSNQLELSRRLHWSASLDADVPLRANMAQLLADLQSEFERTESAGR
jgi:hypothetical protein